MWRQLEQYKNHFLQWSLPHLGPQLINELTFEHFDKRQNLRPKCKTPYLVCQCQQSTYFDDRAQLAYGWFALPKLLREMCSDNAKTTWRAINSLSEFLLNPLNAQRAITEKDVVRLCRNAFLRFQRKYRLEYKFEVARLMHIFWLLTHYLNGAEKIMVQNELLNEFYKMVFFRTHYIEIASRVLRNLSEKPEVLLHLLNKTNSFDKLCLFFKEDNCTPYYPEALWLHLSHFLEVAPENGIQCGLFNMFHERIIYRRFQYHLLNMKCFALMLRCEEGQRCFDEIDGVRMIVDILQLDKPLNNHEYVILALQNGLLSKRALWRAREFTSLPFYLIKIADDSHLFNAPNTQLYCLKALRLLGHMPIIKRYMIDNCFDDLLTLRCCNPLNICLRDDLIAWINRSKLDSCPLKENLPDGTKN